MPLKMRSYLLNAAWMTAQQIQKKIHDAEFAAIDAFVKAHGDQAYVARALLPTDFNSITVNEWQETTDASTIDAWNASLVAPGTTNVRANTVLAIYGVQPVTFENEAGVYAWGSAEASPPVTAMRINGGGARLAAWDLSFLIRATAQTAGLITTSTEYGPQQLHPAGIAAQPLVIREGKAVGIDYWEVTVALDFQIAILGFVVEPVGGHGGITVGG